MRFKKKDTRKALSRTKERDCINLLKSAFINNTIERMYNATSVAELKVERKLLREYVDRLYDITKEKFLYEMEDEPTKEYAKEVKIFKFKEYNEDEDDRLQH